MLFGSVASDRITACTCPRTRVSASSSNRGCASAWASRSAAASRFSVRDWKPTDTVSSLAEKDSRAPRSSTAWANCVALFDPAPSSSSAVIMLTAPRLPSASMLAPPRNWMSSATKGMLSSWTSQALIPPGEVTSWISIACAGTASRARTVAIAARIILAPRSVRRGWPGPVPGSRRPPPLRGRAAASRSRRAPAARRGRRPSRPRR